jgi:Uma2 family endonuclease
LLVEVTSDSTEDDDRGTKFLHDQAIAELRDYLVVSHRDRRIDHFRRLDDGQWHLTAHTRDEAAVAPASLEATFALGDVYADVALDEGRH